MTKNYYTTEHQNIHNYQQRRNYFSCEVTTFPDVDYTILPEEYAIFNQISTEFFHKNGTKQRDMVATCLQHLKELLLSFHRDHGVICVLPKLRLYTEEDETIVLNWAYSGFRAFFSFGGEAADYDSFCGIVIQNDINSVMSQTKRINIENYKEVINELLLYVISYA